MSDDEVALDEHLRLAELHRLNVLDTPREAAFDSVTELARRVYQVPIALISLVDESRQWFKSCQGLGVGETPREISFCTHAIKQPDVFIVGDAAIHPTFKSNPLVVGPPHIRFYAGAPLNMRSGLRIGTLCIIDGQPRHFGVSETRSLVQLASIVVDELELRRTNAELAEARHRLEVANMAKARYVATVSHEIRTPVFAVSSLSELAFAKTRSKVQREYLGKIIAMNRTLLALIDDILDISRSEMGTPEARTVRFSVYDVLDKVRDILSVRADVRNVALTSQVAADVPRALRGDETRLFQVLLNLVNNAIKFTERGSVDVGVALKAKGPDTARLLFSVHDTGIGIAPDRLEAIFKEGERGNEARGSAGLGLAIVRRFVALLGGSISVRSAQGRGSTFSFEAEFGLTTARRERDLREPESGPGHLQGLRVLLVEDGEISREAVRGLLENAGAVVDCADDGVPAVTLVENGDLAYDLALMDLRLPTMDGIEATRRIRKIFGPAALPVIGFSADRAEDVEAACLDVGMNAYLAKPASWERLSALIRETVGGDPRRPADVARRGGTHGGADGGTLDARLTGMFRDRYAETPSVIRGALDDGGFSEAAKLLHTLRGSAAMIGARDVAAAAKALEAKVGGPDTEVAPALEAFEKAIGAWLERNSAKE